MGYSLYMPIQYKSATQFLLMSLVPFTEPNLLLAYKPNQFFNKLEQASQYNQKQLRKAYYRAKQRGLVEDTNGQIYLSLEARRQVFPYVAKKFDNGCLMVIFDIPNELGYKRRKFRLVLRMLKFYQVQKSVWASEYDSRTVLSETIRELDLGDYIEVYEAAKLRA